MRERAIRGAQSPVLDKSATWKARLLRRSALLMALSLGTAMTATLATGCAVGEGDLHRWQVTEHGPEKLYAVVTHAKYSWPLRVQAAMALVEMKPRDGNRVGLKYLVDGVDQDDGSTMPGALSVLQDDARRRVLADVTPLLVTGMQLRVPPPRADGCTEPDPSIPYKDAAFAMLTHDPPLVGDDKNKSDLNDALLAWVQTDFEARIDNSAQEFPADKVMSYLGKDSVSKLPSLVSETSEKVARVAALVQSLGDADTKLAMSQALVNLAKAYESADWMSRTSARVKQVYPNSDDKKVDQQVKETQKNRFLDPSNGVFVTMKSIGMRPVIDYCIDYAVTHKTDVELRKASLAAIDGQLFKGDPKDPAVKAANQKDIDRLFTLVADESVPDEVRGLALKRLQEAPSDIMKASIVPKLYTLFDGKKWQTRRAAATLILLQLSTSDIKDFLAHLPKSPDQEMAMTEAIVYGGTIGILDPKGGAKPRDVLAPFLTGKDLGPKLAAIGSFYGGKKSDASALSAVADDTSPIPKCEIKDGCGWADTGCMVKKDGGKAGELEKKTIATVGDFVKYCVMPGLSGS